MTNSSKETRKPDLVRLDDQVKEVAANVKSISIGESCADVKIRPIDEEEISIHFYGTVDIANGSVGLKLSCKKGILNISLAKTGKLRKNQLSLDIYIPKDKVLEDCIIRSSGDITVEEGIKAEYISAVSTYGSIQISSQFENACLNATNGIVVDTRAEINLTLEVISTYGDINLRLDNVANILYHNLGNTSLHGHLKDNHKPTVGGFVAQIKYNAGVNTITVE